MTELLTLDDLDLGTLRGQRVFVRVDFNVPLSDAGEVAGRHPARGGAADHPRADAMPARSCCSPPTPAGPRGSAIPATACARWRRSSSSCSAQAVRFADDCVGEEVEKIAREMDPGEVLLLENLRFHAGEDQERPRLRRPARRPRRGLRRRRLRQRPPRPRLGGRGAPSACRARPPAGCMAREVEALGRLLGEPERPFAALLGGAKIEGKIDTLENLLPRLDMLLLGGGMANTFLAAQGHDLGGSLYEPDRLDMARDILERAQPARHRGPAPRRRGGGRPTWTTRTASRPSPPTRSPPASRRWTSGPKTRKAFAEAVGRAQHPVLERSAGRLREAAVRRRHPRGGAGPGRLPRLLGDRRRRDRGRRAPGRRHRSHRPRLDRRRRLAGVPGRQAPCPAWRSWRRRSEDTDASPPTGR